MAGSCAWVFTAACVRLAGARQRGEPHSSGTARLFSNHWLLLLITDVQTGLLLLLHLVLQATSSLTKVTSREWKGPGLFFPSFISSLFLILWPRRWKISHPEVPWWLSGWESNLTMQRTQVWSLIQADYLMLLGATKPVSHNHWVRALEPASHNYWGPCASSLCSATGSHHIEKPVHHNED